MVLFATYLEIEDYAIRRDRNIEIRFVDTESVKIGVSVDLILKRVFMGMTIRVVSINSSLLELAYSSNWFVKTGVAGVMKMIGYLQPDIKTAVKSITGNKLLIELKSLPQLKETLDKIEIKSLKFNKEGLLLTFNMI